MTTTYDPGYGPLLTTSVRIATWNIWARYGPWEERAPVILETLRGVDADIVGLQEVWDEGERNQAHELAEVLGYEHCVYSRNLERDGVGAGNAIMSRWPIVRSETRSLPRHGAGVADDEGEERLCVFAEVEGPRGRIQIFCAHLSWRGDHSGVRQVQARAICEFVRETRPRSFPAVLVGDLNAEIDADELRMLTGRAASPVPGVVFRDAWEVAGVAPAPTMSRENPFHGGNLDLDRRLDHILVGQPKLGGAGHVNGISRLGHHPIAGIYGSDHYGVVANLRY